MIGIIDYGLGNSLAVVSAFEEIGVESVLLDSPKRLTSDIKGLVIPGVGSFKEGMNKLDKSGWKKWLISNGSQNIPVLGICLGMQLFFDSSEESPDVAGLGLIQGCIEMLKSGIEPIPNMGWRNVSTEKAKNTLFTGIENLSFYHVHSFGLIRTHHTPSATINFNDEIINVAVHSNQIFGVQFHPEKSLKQGLKILDNYYRFCNK